MACTSGLVAVQREVKTLSVQSTLEIGDSSCYARARRFTRENNARRSRMKAFKNKPPEGPLLRRCKSGRETMEQSPRPTAMLTSTKLAGSPSGNDITFPEYMHLRSVTDAAVRAG